MLSSMRVEDGLQFGNQGIVCLLKFLKFYNKSTRQSKLKEIAEVTYARRWWQTLEPYPNRASVRLALG